MGSRASVGSQRGPHGICKRVVVLGRRGRDIADEAVCIDYEDGRTLDAERLGVRHVELDGVADLPLGLAPPRVGSGAS
jgi:hypothetical protein